MDINKSKQIVEMLKKQLQNNLGQLRKTDRWFEICNIEDLEERRQELYGYVIDFTNEQAAKLSSTLKEDGKKTAGAVFTKNELLEGYKFVAAHLQGNAYGKKLEDQIRTEKKILRSKMKEQIEKEFADFNSKSKTSGRPKTIYAREFKYLATFTDNVALKDKLAAIDELAKKLVDNAFSLYQPKFAKNQELAEVIRQGLVQDTVSKIRNEVLDKDEKKQVSIEETQEKYELALALQTQEKAAAERTRQIAIQNNPLVRYKKVIDEVVKKLALVENDERRAYLTYQAAQQFMEQNGLIQKNKAGKIDAAHKGFYEAQNDANDFWYGYFSKLVEEKRQEILRGREQGQIARMPKASLYPIGQRSPEEVRDTDEKLDKLTDFCADLVLSTKSTEAADANWIWHFALSEAKLLLGDGKAAQTYLKYLNKEIEAQRNEFVEIDLGEAGRVTELPTGDLFVERGNNDEQSDEQEPIIVRIRDAEPVVKDPQPQAPANQKNVGKKIGKGFAVVLGIGVAAIIVTGASIGLNSLISEQKQPTPTPPGPVVTPTNYAELGENDANAVRFDIQANKNYQLEEFGIKSGLSVNDEVKKAEKADQTEYAESFGETLAVNAVDRLQNVANLIKETAKAALASGITDNQVMVVYPANDFTSAAEFKSELKEAGMTQAMADTVVATYEETFKPEYRKNYDASNFEIPTEPQVKETLKLSSEASKTAVFNAISGKSYEFGGKQYSVSSLDEIKNLTKDDELLFVDAENAEGTKMNFAISGLSADALSYQENFENELGQGNFNVELTNVVEKVAEQPEPLKLSSEASKLAVFNAISGKSYDFEGKQYSVSRVDEIKSMMTDGEYIYVDAENAEGTKMNFAISGLSAEALSYQKNFENELSQGNFNVELTNVVEKEPPVVEHNYDSVFSGLISDGLKTKPYFDGNKVYAVTEDNVYVYTLGEGIDASSLSDQALKAAVASAGPTTYNSYNDSEISFLTSKSDSLGRKILSEKQINKIMTVAAKKIPGAERVEVSEIHETSKEQGNWNACKVTLLYMGYDAEGNIVGTRTFTGKNVYAEQGKAVDPDIAAIMTFAADGGLSITTVEADGGNYGYNTKPSAAKTL